MTLYCYDWLHKIYIVCLSGVMGMGHNSHVLLTTALQIGITWRPAIQHYDPGHGEMSAISDHNNATCLTFMNSRVLLVGSLRVMYKTLHVAVHTNYRSLRFHGETCANVSSVLMSHVGPENGSSCNPFCGVPTVCRFKGNHDTDSIITTSHFECVCAAQSCSEILLWVWGEPGELVRSVCEIEVLEYNW